MDASPDVLISWLNVHGGVFHKLMRLQELLVSRGVSCELLFAAGPPRGLKLGVDVPEEMLSGLERSGIHFLPREEVLRRTAQASPKLLICDAHHDPDLPKLIAQARGRGVVTAQMATLLGDFTCHGAEHLLLQHPLTLFFELEYSRTPESSRFSECTGIHFTGNIFFEPTLNPLFGGFDSRQSFCQKYGFDPTRPICLWLPSYEDARHPDYGRIVRAVDDAGMNLAVKLHPWEYTFLKHGTDTWGLGATSNTLWGATALAEPDSSWAFFYCDAAILRTSTTCIELPFWEKPSLLMPSTAFAKLVQAQSNMVGSCSKNLNSMDAFESYIKAGKLPRYAASDFETARAKVRQRTEVDAYTQTIESIQSILDDPAGAGIHPGDGPLGRLYYPHVDGALARSLPMTRRLRYEAGRMLQGGLG